MTQRPEEGLQVESHRGDEMRLIHAAAFWFMITGVVVSGMFRLAEYGVERYVKTKCQGEV